MTEKTAIENPAPGPSGLGRKLAEARRSRSLSLRDAALELKLAPYRLELIEAGRFGELPAAYLRGYLRNYADLLGLDPEPLLAALPTTELPALQAVHPAPRQHSRWVWLSGYLSYALVSLVIVAPLVYFFVVGSVQLIGDGLVAGKDPSGAAAGEVATLRERLGSMFQSEAPAGTGDTHVQASALPLTAIRPVSSVDASAGAERSGAGEAASGGSADDEPQLSTVEVVVSGDSWVEIEDAEGRRLEFDLLRSGMSRRYQGRAPFRVLLGRSNAVTLSVDGRPVSVPGSDRGGVARLTLTANRAPAVVDSGSDTRPEETARTDG